MNCSDDFFERASHLVSRLEDLFGKNTTDELSDATAWRWRKAANGDYLQAIKEFDSITLKDLLFIDHQKKVIERNTKQFLEGLPANNVLLWGPRGIGKSSLIKALFNDYAEKGLRLIEVERTHLIDLPEILSKLKKQAHRYLIFCDDLTFDGHDTSYRTLKTVLDGSILSTSNTIIYATSNRRHLLPEYVSDNSQSRIDNNELHHSEAVEEKISLSERFGIWLSFHPYKQDSYLDIVEHWLKLLDSEITLSDIKSTKNLALQWALQRGSRSGRTAYQFARDWIGQKKLGT